MSLKTDLIAAKALIADPDSWCKRPGYVMRPDGTMAQCTYAALGAVRGNRRAMFVAAVRALPLLWKLRWKLGSFPNGEEQAVIRFNDHPKTTHADIMALFDRAISSAS